MAAINDLPSYWIGTSTNYAALASKDANAIYFLTDTRQIARGEVTFSQDAQFVATLPASGIRGVIYFDTTKQVASIWDGTKWNAIGVITVSAIEAGTDASAVPNVGAVKAYVGAEIETLEDTVNTELGKKVDKVTGKSLVSDTEITKLATYPADYQTVKDLIDSKATPADISTALTGYYTKGEVDGKLASVFDFKGTKATEAELPAADNKVGDVWHVTAGAKEFAWDGEQWEELGGIIDLSNYYTKAEADNAISTAVGTAKTELNGAIALKEDKTVVTALAGRVTAVESGKVDKVVGAEDGVVVFGADGAVADSGMKIGGAEVAASGNDKLLATEAAVKKIVGDSVVEGGTTKMNFVDAADAGKIIVADTDGDAKASAVKVGGATFAATGNSAFLANEQAIIDLLAWKTIPQA